MGVNKVEVNGEAIVDLTNDSVTPETLAEGETAHNKAGDPIVGTMSRQVEWDNVLNKPFSVVGGDILTDDGLTEGKVVANNIWYKVSDSLPTANDIANGATLDLGYTSGTVTIDRETSVVHMLMAFNTTFAYVVYNAPASTQDGMSFPETGIYYNYELVGGTTTHLTINGYDGFNHTEVLNPENLPEHTHNEEVVTTTGTNTAYEASVPRITALTAGVTFIMKPHITSNSIYPTLKVNGLSAVRLYRRGSDAASVHGGNNASWLRSGQPYRVMYNGSYWIVTDFIKPSASDLDGRVPETNGGVPNPTNVSDGQILITEGGTAKWKNPPTTTGVEKVTSIDTYTRGVSNLVTSGGITWQDGFEFVDDSNEGEVIAQGLIYHNVPIVAGKNVTFEVEGNEVKINAEGGNGNGVLSVTVETDYPTPMSAIIEAIQNAGGDLSKLTFVTLTGYLTRNLAMSFAWRGGNYYRAECIDLGNMEKIYNTDTDNSIYDVTSKRIEDFLNEGTLQATEEEMPQIRFTSATGSTENDTPNLYVDVSNPLKLTVEIVGGTLQVGDQLQVCIRKRFDGCDGNGNRRKYKLQRFAEYVVTENDLDKKYLTVPIFIRMENRGKEFRGLFRDGNLGQLSPLYLRIRRAKGDMQNNNSGQTVDADFSNIVTIWKHHHRNYQTVRIY